MLVVNGLCNYCNTMVKPILLQRSLKMITLTKTTAFSALIQIVSVTSRHMKFFRKKLRIASLGVVTHCSRNTIA
jgi:capsule polysaccharide modification protein KpsS